MKLSKASEKKKSFTDEKKFALRKDKKDEGRRNPNAREHLCIQNKPQSVHASSVEKDVAIDKDGYSVQLAERERGGRGELFTIEPAPCRVVRGFMPHLGITTTWARSPGESAR